MLKYVNEIEWVLVENINIKKLVIAKEFYNKNVVKNRCFVIMTNHLFIFRMPVWSDIIIKRKKYEIYELKLRREEVMEKYTELESKELKEQTQALILGLAIGDALGVPV